MYPLLHRFNEYPYWLIYDNTKQVSSNILPKNRSYLVFIQPERY